MAITKKTEALVNDLIQGMTRSAIDIYKSGQVIESADIEALASLITSVQGGNEDKSPICGFIIPTPPEEDDDE